MVVLDSVPVFWVFLFYYYCMYVVVGDGFCLFWFFYGVFFVFILEGKEF